MTVIDGRHPATHKEVRGFQEVSVKYTFLVGAAGCLGYTYCEARSRSAL